MENPMRLRSTVTILITLVAAACGGAKGGTATTTPDEPGPTVGAGSDTGTGSGSAVEDPVTPPEPDKPAPPPEPDPATVKAELLAAETGAWDTAKPVFEKYCSGCHTDGGKKASKKKLDHFNMSTYPPGGHHTATIGFTIREVLGQAGKKATMPYGKAGSVQGDDLATIIAWTNAWEAAEKGGAHPPVPAGAGKDND
jgi:mono/diheme cytochrome c family protein